MDVVKVSSINYACCDPIYRIPENSTIKSIKTNKQVWKDYRIENQYAQKAVACLYSVDNQSQ